MIKVKDIVYENGASWVLRSGKESCYFVMVNGVSLAKSDSAYPLDEDGLSIAKARCDWLAKREAERQPTKKVVLLDDRHVIIDAPGRYIARNGRVVEIFRIDDPKKSTFNCKGLRLRKGLNGKVERKYDIWHPSGARLAISESPWDVITKEKS
ncbi:hypothetical protein [Castellaniella sp.]|uniref:hypothetical protein n=1 Tax=Castellaniella sp. TaxID=1955812 RepID=UPI002AFE3776|nr:hypothetical protein [Castellaniella sp.]